MYQILEGRFFKNFKEHLFLSIRELEDKLNLSLEWSK